MARIENYYRPPGSNPAPSAEARCFRRRRWTPRALIIAWLVIAVSSARAGEAPALSLAGVVDLHCHTGPDAVPRSITDLELARRAKAEGMRAIVLKNHYTMTAARAQIAMLEVPGIEVFGGVVLNRAVGGINAEAVRRMTQMAGRRGKIVWLPTFDAEKQVRFAQENRPFVAVVRDNKPVPELREVFELIAQHDLVLATGHSGADESIMLIASARQAGIKRILVTHVLAESIGATPDHMRKMADAGAIMECTWLAHFNGAAGAINVGKTVPVKVCADFVQGIGAEHFIISSDFGQQGNPLPPEGMKAFITALRAEGVSQEQIDLMARKTPARLLGLEP